MAGNKAEQLEGLGAAGQQFAACLLGLNARHATFS